MVDRDAVAERLKAQLWEASPGLTEEQVDELLALAREAGRRLLEGGKT